MPVGGLALILSIDRLTSEARALTNPIGNGDAAVVVAGWENKLDDDCIRRLLDGSDGVRADNQTAVATA